MIRILQIVPNMQAGGIETWLMNQYRCLDRTKIQYDFLVHYQQRFFYDDEIEQLGGRIFRCSMREDNNIIKYIAFLFKLFKTHKEYKVIHGHMPSFSFIFMGVARICHVPVRINHSHNTSFNRNLKGYIEFLLTKLVKINSNYLFACSDLAGKYMYGKAKYTIIHNAIDVNRFMYNSSVRDELRKELGIEDKFVIGHIGRFTLQKNHEFLIDIFYDFLSRKDKNAVLLLIGTGELLDKVMCKIKELKIEDSVIYLGVRADTYRLYQVFDCFLLPSFYEGLPVVGVEAQAAGVPMLVSDSVTKEVGLLPTTLFLPIDNGTTCWCESLLNISFDAKSRIEAKDIVTSKGYSIDEETKRITDFYTSLYLKNSI